MMWILLQKENGDEFVVNEESIKKIEKISFNKTERVVVKSTYIPLKGDREPYTLLRDKSIEDENFRFNIYYDDGESELEVIILSIGNLDLFYEEGGYLKEIIKSKTIDEGYDTERKEGFIPNE